MPSIPIQIPTPTQVLIRPMTNHQYAIVAARGGLHKRPPAEADSRLDGELVVNKVSVATRGTSMEVLMTVISEVRTQEHLVDLVANSVLSTAFIPAKATSSVGEGRKEISREIGGPSKATSREVGVPRELTSFEVWKAHKVSKEAVEATMEAHSKGRGDVNRMEAFLANAAFKG